MSVTVAGELEALGFDEVEPGVVEDTAHNRKRLMGLVTEGTSWSWERITDENGEHTGLIRALSPEQRTERRREVALRRRPILVDPEDPWSDYIHPDDYPLDLDLPYWVEMRLRRWRELAADGVPESDRRPFPIRCTQLRTDNTRCWLWVNKPQDSSRCAKHSGLTNEAVEKNPAYARMRVLEASTDAVDSLVYLMHYAEGEAVRLKASTEILDRAGVRGGVELDITGEITHVDPAQALADRLKALAKRNEDVVTEEPHLALPAPDETTIVEAEIVDEEQETA